MTTSLSTEGKWRYCRESWRQISFLSSLFVSLLPFPCHSLHVRFLLSLGGVKFMQCVGDADSSGLLHETDHNTLHGGLFCCRV